MEERKRWAMIRVRESAEVRRICVYVEYLFRSLLIPFILI